jgi:hypothetical protein
LQAFSWTKTPWRRIIQRLIRQRTWHVPNLLGNAAIPVELWGVVFVGAFVSWGLSETIARFVWANAEETGRQ